MILVHNHPSGSLMPSPQDDDLTHRIAQAGKLFGIPVRDHLIVTAKGYYSYHDEGKVVAYPRDGGLHSEHLGERL